MNQQQRQEIVKSGLIVALGVTALTGFRILRPMKLHPVAGSIFLVLSLAHLLMNSGRSRRKGDRTTKSS